MIPTPSSTPPAADRPGRRVGQTALLAAILLAVALTVASAGLYVIRGQGRTVPDVELTVRAADTGTTSAARPNTVLPDDVLRAGPTDERSYLRFELGQLTAGTVVGVRLVLTAPPGTTTAAPAADTAGPGLSVHEVTGSWSGTTITHNLRPATTGEQLNLTAPAVPPGSTVSVPLEPAAFQAAATVSLELRHLRAGTTAQFERTGPNAPKLVLTTQVPTTQPPVAPTTEQHVLAVADAGSVASSKKVFAHYFPPYPVSFDNLPAERDYYARHYLDPQGEGGKHLAYGGLLRDRPLPVEPSADPDWELRNLEREIEQAKRAGIDGFVVDLLSAQGRNWETAELLLQAADNVGGFSVAPMVDATASFADRTPAEVADQLAPLFAHASAYRTGEGYLLSSFAAERKPVTWWQDLVTDLEQRHRVPITLQAVFLGAGPEHLADFAPIADGYGSWGARSPGSVDRMPDFAARAHQLGKTWMEPVTVQDVRHRTFSYAESQNTDVLRGTWRRAIEGDADHVQLVTWNDYSESTGFAPSRAHGWAFLSAVSYYATWFHTGQQPVLTADTLVVSHRTQFTDAASSLPPMDPTLAGSDTPPRNTVEVLALLREPGEVRVSVGGTVTTFSAPAGVSVHTVPLGLGEVAAALDRGGSRVIRVASPYEVVADPEVRDLQYHAAAVTG
ncbi:endo-1,3-alpha-glucanase family glycosylhydrolase [Microlunatus sp. Y2014]|uniref:endo-1,3-alpha-glucanase family glycosylhydrolase n=1 Tax=Microlunatus sp. Y2014 TaxID=3418488 RepID=UPI003DA789B4